MKLRVCQPALVGKIKLSHSVSIKNTLRSFNDIHHTVFSNIWARSNLCLLFTLRPVSEWFLLSPTAGTGETFAFSFLRGETSQSTQARFPQTHRMPTQRGSHRWIDSEPVNSLKFNIWAKDRPIICVFVCLLCVCVCHRHSVIVSWESQTKERSDPQSVPFDKSSFSHLPPPSVCVWQEKNCLPLSWANTRSKSELMSVYDASVSWGRVSCNNSI